MIGCGLRGLGLGHCLSGLAGVEVRAVSDVYIPRIERATRTLGQSPLAVSDYRRMLDNRDIDGVVVATPDHWHASMAGDGVAAGKDVYLEKPVTHKQGEGDWLLQQVANTDRVVATGTQQRCWDHFREARSLISEGTLGKVTLARSYWHQGHLPRGGPSGLDINPADLDWRSWLGPARDQPLDPVRFQYWRFFWDFGGGSVGDLMTHWIDVIQWYLASGGPSRVLALGRTSIHDWFETPDVVTAAMQFPGGFTATFDGSLTFGLGGCGIALHGDRATMLLDRSGFEVYEEAAATFESRTLPDPIHRRRASEATTSAERMDGSGTQANLQDWLDCMRSRRRPRASLQAGVEAADTAHLVNKALRANQPLESR